MKTSSKKIRVVVDTSVVIDYIIENTPYRNMIDKLFTYIESSKVLIYLSPITLTEIFYVADRIYKIAKIKDPNIKAKEFMMWIKSKSKVVPINEEIIEISGEIKKKFHLSLSDSYAIATGIFLGHNILFRKPEKEMIKNLEKLKEIGVIFLEDFISKI